MTAFITEVDEKNLLYRLASGDEEAFESIYNHYWKCLFTLAAQKLNNLAEAEEVVQDIFLDIWKRRENLNINCLSSFLAVSVKYKVINILASRSQRRRYINASQAMPSADESTEETIRFNELKRLLGSETARLPDRCRLVFRLSKEHGVPQKRIAVLLGISERTVESHIAKALKSLRANLGHIISLLFFFN